MKRSIVYAGLCSVMAIVPAMTEQAFAMDSGNLSDAVTTSLIPTITWVEIPAVAPEVSSAVVPPSDMQTATVPSGDNTPAAPSGEGTTTTTGEGTAPEKSADDMDMKSERMRKVGAPRF